MRCAGDLAADDAAHLGELGHQVRARVQAPGRVHQHDVDLAGEGRLHAVERDGRRIGTRCLPHQDRARSLGPHGELLDGGRPERIGRHEENATTGFRMARAELPDGSGLSDSVHPGDEDDPRAPGRCRRRRRIEHRHHLLAERPAHLGRLRGTADALPKSVEQRCGRPHADVGGDERFLELGEDGVQARRSATECRVDLLEKPPPGGGEPTAEAVGGRRGRR